MSFSDSTNQNGGIQIYPILKKNGKTLHPVHLNNKNFAKITKTSIF
jgi:hypothetical protein